MAFEVGAVQGQLVLDINGWQNSIKTVQGDISTIQAKISAVGAGMKDFGQNLGIVGRQISRVGTSLAFLGAGILTPLTAAFFSAEKYSNNVRVEVDRLNNVFLELRRSVGDALVPVMHQLSNILADFLNRWLALPAATRENILRFTFMTGAALVLAGGLIIVIGKIVSLVSALWKLGGAFVIFAAANPVLLLTEVAITGIVIAMLKWKVVGDIVMNTFQILFDMTRIGFNSILYLTNSITSAFFAAATGALKFNAAIAFGRDAKNQLNDLAQGAWKLSQQYSELANNNLRNIASAGQDAFHVLSTGQSNASMVFDNLKNTIDSLFDNLGKIEIHIPKIMEAPKTFAQGWRDAIDATINDLSNWGNMAGNIVTQTTTSMQNSFSNFFNDAFHGQLKKGADYFAEFGESVLKMISDIIARMMVLLIIKLLFKSLGGGGGIVGGAITGAIEGSMGFAEGTDFVPYTGNYKLHEGEKVTPKYDATKGEKQNITYNIYAADAASFEELCIRNPRGIHIAVQEAQRLHKVGFRR